MDYDIALIQQTLVFDGLTPFEIKQIFEECATKIEVTKGSKIIQEGSEDDDLYFLPSGKAQVELELGHLFNRQLTEIKGPVVLGEMSYLDKSPRSSTVTAAEDCEIYVINGQSLDVLLTEMPNTGYKISKNIALSLSKIVRRSTDMISKEVQRNQLLHKKTTQLADNKYKESLSNIAHYINRSA